MADEKISQLASGTPAQSNDLLPIARSGANFSLTASSIAALAVTNVTASAPLVSSGGLTPNLTATTLTSGTRLLAVVASADLTSQSASISATTIYTPSVTGMYRVSFSVHITTAATSTSSINFMVLATSPDDSVVKTYSQADTGFNQATTNTTGTAMGSSYAVYAKTGTAIQYQTAYTSTGGTAMVYSLHIVVESV